MSITLSGITWDDPRGYGPLRSITSAFVAQEEEGVDVQWDKQPLGGFESRPPDQLASRYDLLVMDHPHTADAARAGCLSPVGDMNESYVGKTLESYRWDDVQWAVPIDAACHVAAFRSDALAEVPKTWEQVESLSDRGTRVAIPLAGVHSLMALLSLVASLGESMSEPIDWSSSPAVRQSLQLLKRLCQGNSRRGLDWNPIQALGALAEGRCDYLPLTFGYAHWQTRGIGFASIPAWDTQTKPRGVLGGAGMAVSAHSPHQQLALRYARFCGTARTQTELWPTDGGQPAHSAAWELLGQSASFYRDTRVCIESAFLRPRHQDWNNFQSTAGAAIEGWLRHPTAAPIELQHELEALCHRDRKAAS